MLDPLSNCIAISTSYVDTTVATQAGIPAIGGVAIPSGSFFVLANQDAGATRSFKLADGIWTLTYDYALGVASNMVWRQVDSIDAMGALFVGLNVAAASFSAYSGGPVGCKVFLDASGDSISRNDETPVISIYERVISQDTNRGRGNEWIETEIHDCTASLWAPTRGTLRMLRSFFITTAKLACGNNIFNATNGEISSRGFESYGIEVKLEFSITSQLPRYGAGVIWHTATDTDVDYTDTPNDGLIGHHI